MKKIIIILLTFLLTGCTSYTELNDLSIVNTLGIDYNDEYKVYLTYKDSNNKSNTITSKDKSLKEAINKFYLSSDKMLYMSHINLLILTEEAINNKLDYILDNFLNDNNYRNNFYVVIMDSNDMKDFFESKLESDNIIGLININEKETSTTKKIELEELIKELDIDNNYYLPKLTYKNKELSLNGYSLIKNKKVYENIDYKESIILNILSNNYNKAYLDGTIIYKGATNISLNNNKIIFNIKITTNKNDTSDLKEKLISFINKYKNDYDILKINSLIKRKNYKSNYTYKDVIYEIKIDNTIKENYIKVDEYEQISK